VLDAGPDQRAVWRRFGVEYTLAEMDVLLYRIGWSVQVPARRAASGTRRRLPGGGRRPGLFTAVFDSFRLIILTWSYDY
jgi:hypothetical protein